MYACKSESCIGNHTPDNEFRAKDDPMYELF